MSTYEWRRGRYAPRQVVIPIDEYVIIQEYCKVHNLSFSAFALQAIREKMERERQEDIDKGIS